MLREGYGLVKCMLRAVCDFNGARGMSKSAETRDGEVARRGQLGGPPTMVGRYKNVKRVGGGSDSAPFDKVFSRRFAKTDGGGHDVFIGRGGPIDHQNIRVDFPVDRR